jgi:hypothetical protein
MDVAPIPRTGPERQPRRSPPAPERPPVRPGPGGRPPAPAEGEEDEAPPDRPLGGHIDVTV